MIQTTRLANGVRVITRPLPQARGATLAIWFLHGARHEAPDEAGYAHLCEHLLFRTAGRQGLPDLAERIDMLGGEVNAHTGRELSTVHGTVPREDLPALAELLASLVLSPDFEEETLAVEKNIVLSELAETANLVGMEEAAVCLAWKGHPLARPVIGDANLTGATADRLQRYWQRQITGGRVWVVATGGCVHEEVVRGVAALGRLPAGDRPSTRPPTFDAGEHHGCIAGAQSQLLWVMPAPAAGQADQPGAVVANQVLGGGLSSRLFRAVREHRGLAYGIQSRLEFYSDAGLWLIGASSPAEHADACRACVERELDDLAAHGPTEREMEVAHRHLRARLLLEQDDTSACAERLAWEAIYLGEPREMDAVLQSLSAVTSEAVRERVRAARARTLFISGTGAPGG